MAITQSTPDCHGQDLESLIYSIAFEIAKHKDALALEESIRPDEFHQKVNNLQELFYERTSVLSKNALADHHFLWLVSLKTLGSYVVKYKTFYHNKYLEDLRYDEPLNNVLGTLSVKLTKLSGDFGDLMNHFLGNSDLNVSTFLKATANTDFIHQQFCHLVIDSLEILVIDHAGDILDNSIVYLNPIQKVLLHYFEIAYKYGDRSTILRISFPVISQFARIMYIVGESQLLLPFLESDIIHPQLGIEVVKSTAVDLIDLINYYKFVAFNLVAISLQQNSKILGHYNVQGHTYFKVLLNFPNLSLGVYEPLSTQISKDDAPPSLMGFNFQQETDENLLQSLLDRQEISLLFILNFLLKLTNLRPYVEQNDNLYKKELVFLKNSLAGSLSKEINRSASRSGSVNSSTVSFDRLRESEIQKRQESSQFKSVNRLRLKSLSAVLLHGSYKEKLILIGQVIKLFDISKLHILSEDSTFDDNDSILYSVGEHSTGKILYISAIERISKVLVALSVKYMVKSCGFNNFPEDQLKKICSPHSMSDTFRVKELFQYDGFIEDNKKVIVIGSNSEKCAEISEIIQKQLEIAGISSQLKKIIAKQ